MRNYTRKKATFWVLVAALTLGLWGCGGSGNADSKNSGQTGIAEADGTQNGNETEQVTILVAAAASLENCLTEELIPLFEEQHPDIRVEGTYDSSGKLQTQIEQGLQADVFFSAAEKQMNALVEEGYIEEEAVVSLLENKLVLIVPADSDQEWTAFADAAEADMVAVGDPASVPAGQYAQEAFETLGIWETITQHCSYGTNVTEVLNWVAAKNADCGVVYATDAAGTNRVRVAAEAPADALQTPIIYPVAALKESAYREQADAFVTFLQTAEAKEILARYGFSPMD